MPWQRPCWHGGCEMSRNRPMPDQEAVLMAAQRLGLVAPCVVKTWPPWWQEARFHAKRLPEIRLSRKLLHPVTRRWVLERYTEFGGETTVAGLIAHELGHVFRYTWIRNRKIAPLRGYRAVFGHRARFDDPWNDMVDTLAARPDLSLDTDRYLNWYAWSDHEEDFCECFAALILANGDCRGYRDRPGIHRKLQFIRRAGQQIRRTHPVLRKATREGMPYLSAGDISFTCPEQGHRYGVPDRVGQYACPCGQPVTHDGTWITHQTGAN